MNSTSQRSTLYDSLQLVTRIDYTKALRIRPGDDPKSLKIYKLALNAYLNGILRMPNLKTYNPILNAALLIDNMRAASVVYTQYNFIDMYPYTGKLQRFENGNNGIDALLIPPFSTSRLMEKDFCNRIYYYAFTSNTYKKAVELLNKLIDHQEKRIVATLYAECKRINRMPSHIYNACENLTAKSLFAKNNDKFDSLFDAFTMSSKYILDEEIPISRKRLTPSQVQKRLRDKSTSVKSKYLYSLFVDRNICILNQADGEITMHST